MYKQIHKVVNPPFLFLLCMGMLVCGSCIYRSVANRCINFARADEPITMFDRYELAVSGCVDTTHDTCDLNCHVNFIEDVPATTDFDSIPILVIDSFCFSGGCLESDYCRIPESEYDWSRRMISEGRRMYTEPKDPSDIAWSKKEIWPRGFLVTNYVFPELCQNDDITLVIVARLFDRASGDEIGREEKTIRLSVERGKRYLYR